MFFETLSLRYSDESLFVAVAAPTDRTSEFINNRILGFSFSVLFFLFIPVNLLGPLRFMSTVLGRGSN